MTRRLKVMSSTATGLVVPYTMMDIQEALRDLGHEVLVQDNTALANRNEVVLNIVEGLVRFVPDLVFTVDHVALLPDILCVLEQPPRVISWLYDDPARYLTEDFLAINSHYHLFCWDRAYLPALRQRGFAHVYYQPLATNPKVYQPCGGGQFEYEVSFVGACSPPRLALLMRLAEAGISVDVFGDEQWRRAAHPNLRYHGVAHNRRDCPRIYSQSRINLNITSQQLITALPVRVYDVLACGGFLLTDSREDLKKYFVEGGDLAVYGSFDELVKKIRQYLKQPDECARLGASGRQKILKWHTFAAAVPDMLTAAVSLPPDFSSNRPLPPAKLRRSLLLTGLAYTGQGNYAAAQPRLMDALKIVSHQPDGLMALHLLARATGQADTARMCYEQARAASQGKHKAGWGTLAEEAAAQKDFSQAIRQVQKAVLAGGYAPPG